MDIDVRCASGGRHEVEDAAFEVWAMGYSDPVLAATIAVSVPTQQSQRPRVELFPELNPYGFLILFGKWPDRTDSSDLAVAEERRERAGQAIEANLARWWIQRRERASYPAIGDGVDLRERIVTNNVSFLFGAVVDQTVFAATESSAQIDFARFVAERLPCCPSPLQWVEMVENLSWSPPG